MSDGTSVQYIFPHLPAAIGRLQTARTQDDLRELARLSLSHVGNETDPAHAFLASIGLTVVNLPGGRRALALTDPSEMTFGRTAEGEQCDKSDLTN